MDKYRVIKTIGKGSYGEVFSAECDGELYAVKAMPIFSDSLVLPAVIWEPLILKTLSHPNIVRAHEIIVEKDFLYMVMPLYVKKACKLDRHILFKLLHAFYYLEEHKILHRDIKPANILFDEDEPIIIDFSISRRYYKQVMKKNVYTIWYRAPEILLGVDNYDWKAEVWALGITCYYYLTWQYPTEELSEDKVLRDLVNSCGVTIEEITDICTHFAVHECIPSPDGVNRISAVMESHAPLGPIITKMLTFDPRKRPSFLDLMCDPFFSDITAPRGKYLVPISNPDSDRNSLYLALKERYSKADTPHLLALCVMDEIRRKKDIITDSNLAAITNIITSLTVLMYSDSSIQDASFRKYKEYLMQILPLPVFEVFLLGI